MNIILVNKVRCLPGFFLPWVGTYITKSLIGLPRWTIKPCLLGCKECYWNNIYLGTNQAEPYIQHCLTDLVSYLFTANTSLQKISPTCYRKPSYKTIVINKCACFHVVGGWLESFLLTSESVEDTGASLFLKLEPQRRFCIAYKKEEKKRRRWMWLSGQVG